jgi:polyhydroxyalkanoate synthesis repressor PhaR
MASERIIKKYPNRRLYDTELSRYITLADVRDLVMRCTPFKVLDSSNDTDITRSILLQIMLEEETGGEPLFTAPMLSQIIRFYGGTLQGLFARYMEHSLDAFAVQQRQLIDAWGETPFKVLGRITRQNLDVWADAQKEILRATGLAISGSRRQEDTVEPPANQTPPPGDKGAENAG